MKIRTSLILGSCILVAFTLGIGAFGVSATRRTDAIARQSALTRTLILDFFEESTLAQEYVAHHDQRPKAQWYLQHESIVRALASPDLQQEPARSRLEALREGVQELKRAFDDLVRQSESPITDPELERSLSGDLLVKSRAVTRLAYDLANAASEARVQVRSEADRLLFSLLATLVVLMSLILFLIYRRIVGSFAKLLKGTRLVGGGDLKYRIGAGGDDEIGQLSQAFDAMAGKLQEAYETLEAKIRERTRELQASNDRNETLLASIGDGVIAIDRAWRITLWNPAAAALTGWKQEEVIGRPLRETIKFIRESDRKENIVFIEEAMLFGEARPMANSTLLITRDGREIPVGDSAAPIFDETGVVAGVIVVFRDVTDERDTHLLRTDFAYASHQMRTPINKALWNVELALEELAGSPVREKVETAYLSLKDIRKLSEALLDVTQIDQGMINVRTATVDAKAILGEVADEARAAGDAKRLTFDVKAVKAAFDVDPKLLKRCLTELVSNAVAYSRPGAVIRLVLRAGKTDVLFEVHDTGIGIAEDQQPLLFTKFFRGQNVPQDTAGAGLGLFIAREYVRLLGGRLWFESKLDGGSSFYLKLPRYPGTII